jgi:hypothetical protein
LGSVPLQLIDLREAIRKIQDELSFVPQPLHSYLLNQSNLKNIITPDEFQLSKPLITFLITVRSEEGKHYRKDKEWWHNLFKKFRDSKRNVANDGRIEHDLNLIEKK